MARKLRVEFAGAFYHVIARGNQRRKIFGDDQDRLYYLERLEQYRKRYRFKIYAYVLMSNHVHWLIETGKTPLSCASYEVERDAKKERNIARLIDNKS